MLRIWSIIEIPPKPNKNAQIIILVDMHLFGIEAIEQIPFVSSSIPVIVPSEKLFDMPNTFKNGDKVFPNISKILLLFKIDIITEKRTINPPIKKIEFIAEIILVDSISPSELKVILLLIVSVFLFSFVFDFQNLNIIPTVIQASI